MGTRLPLTDAALRLGLTYHQVRAMVLRGELKGGRDEYGRFYVVAADVLRAEREKRLERSAARSNV